MPTASAHTGHMKTHSARFADGTEAFGSVSGLVRACQELHESSCVPLQLEQPDQAAAELLALVEHKDASADLCLEALSAIIQETRCGALKPAADVMMERFAEDASVPQVEVRALCIALRMSRELRYRQL